ncbi:LPXTG cell wall anchor domain-containing protein [Enterococcus sp. AZ109]|uniref:LPXTG cell wall anchor domain-containing protein n=1 Tax=Enterococcus sp. AZ109 TaxID=2774634 RepID=UPI003F279435
MKKGVLKGILLSLLVLNFPLATFAETSTSVSDPTAATQEQTVDTNTKDSVTPDKTIDSTVTEDTNKAGEDTNDLTADSTTNSTGSQVSEEPKEKTEDTTPPDEKPKEYTPAVIRDLLANPDYGITATELAGYTDEQLTSAWKLFERYNYDVIGMDLSSYVRVLRMVYKDKVISWEAAEQALAFNPNQYTTCAELIANIDQLYNYVQVLYPNGNGFANLSKHSKETWVHVLNHLAPVQQSLIDDYGSLFNGVVKWLEASSVGNPPIQQPTEEPKPDPKVVPDPKPEPAPVVTKKPDAPARTKKEYPKTGEENTIYLAVAGGIIIILAGSIIVYRKRRAH